MICRRSVPIVAAFLLACRAPVPPAPAAPLPHVVVPMLFPADSNKCPEACSNLEHVWDCQEHEACIARCHADARSGGPLWAQCVLDATAREGVTLCGVRCEP